MAYSKTRGLIFRAMSSGGEQGVSCFEKQQSFVKDSLFSFIQKTIGGTSLGAIDEIVLSYVTSVLEDLGSDTEEEYIEHFDVEQFVEIMGAYFPGFNEIESCVVCDWFFDLARRLSKLDQTDQSSIDTNSECDSTIRLCLSRTSSSNVEEEEESTKNGSEAEEEVEEEEEIEEEQVDSNEDEEQIRLLREMFPNVCVLEMSRCLSIANGCAEKAAQLIMHRLESRESLGSTAIQSVGRKLRNNTLDDKQLKESILSRYAYVDKAEDEREHKPIAPKTEPKKLIRYRDNKIVSIKGEKFSEIKREDEEEIKKATTVSLKPARQYRFH